MPDDPERRLTLRQADQARTDFAAIESDLEFLMHQMAQLPTYRDQCQMLSAQGRGPSAARKRVGWLAVTTAERVFSLALESGEAASPLR
jgi:hypothetical protein